MNEDETGGPAFPLCRTEASGINDCLHTGMMLRDWFAGMALTGLLADQDGPHYSNVALRAYSIADAMLQERMKPKP